MTTLTDLSATFVKLTKPDGSHVDIATMEGSQGVIFDCPKCKDHSILVWFRNCGVPPEATPGPGRWLASGSGLHDLTLSPSINLENSAGIGCQWHGFVKNGEVV